jgi:SAM-dependent methyltransferase
MRAAELGRAIATVSEAYTRDRDAIAERVRGREALEARLRFYLPRDLPKIVRPLRELDAAGHLPRERAWRVLDLGAGLGTTTLGAAWVAKSLGVDVVESVAIDADADALAVFRALAERAGSIGLADVRLTTHVGDLQAFEAKGTFDLVLVGLALNEIDATIDARAAWVEDLRAHLTPGGSIVLLEPALRETARALQELRARIIERGTLRVLAPCLHEDACPLLERERDWCHDEVDLALPGPLAELARSAGLRFEGLSSSYLALGEHGPSLAEALPPSPGRRLRVVGTPRATKGQREVFVCGDAVVRRLVRLDRDARDTEAFDELARGDVIDVEGGTQKESRLRVDRTATITRPSAPRGPGGT